MLYNVAKLSWIFFRLACDVFFNISIQSKKFTTIMLKLPINLTIFLIFYAPVICNHYSPTYGEGRGL